jgi:hypothetical protein
MTGQLTLGSAAPSRESGGCRQAAGMLSDKLDPRAAAATGYREGPEDSDKPSSSGVATASANGAGLGQSGYSAVAGTVAQLIAGGEQQAAACCVRAAFSFGRASKQGPWGQGWMVFCNTHAFQQQQQQQQRQGAPRSSPAPLGPFAAPSSRVVLNAPRPSPSPLVQPPVKTTSISARWRQQIQKKKKRARRTGAAASGGASATTDE